MICVVIQNANAALEKRLRFFRNDFVLKWCVFFKCQIILFLFSLQHWEVFKKVTEVFILVPALLGLKGNLEMTLASRLSTAVSFFLPQSTCVTYAASICYGEPVSGNFLFPVYLIHC